MNFMYQKLEENDTNHWWYKGRRIIIDSLISKLNRINMKILDAGCGYCGNMAMLGKYGEVSGMEINPKVIGTNPWVFKGKIPEPVKFKYNLILLSDVIEHISDEKSTIEWIKNTLTRDGYAVITVPALNSLWSKMDEEVGHFRRYTKKELLELFKDFKIVYISYYNFFLLPLKILSKYKLNSLTYNKLGFIGNLFYGIMVIESWLIRYISFPLGSSLILIIKNV